MKHLKFCSFLFFLIFFLIRKGLSLNTYYPPVKIIFLYAMHSRPDSASKSMRYELTQLSISDSLSEFRSCVRYKGDSLLIKYGNVDLKSAAFTEGMNAVTNLPKYNFKGVIIKNIKRGDCTYYGMIDKVLYYYKDIDYPMSWRILSDTMSMNGYKCQKATTMFEGREYSAWFTRQIPVSNGPYKFGGLPGLIVSISDKTGSYKFELTRVCQSTGNYQIILPGNAIYLKQSGKLVPKKVYYDSYYDFQENFIGKSLATGLVRFDDEEGIRKAYKEKVKHRNNPIELNYKKR